MPYAGFAFIVGGGGDQSDLQNQGRINENSFSITFFRYLFIKLYLDLFIYEKQRFLNFISVRKNLYRQSYLKLFFF